MTPISLALIGFIMAPTVFACLVRFTTRAATPPQQVGRGMGSSKQRQAR